MGDDRQAPVGERPLTIVAQVVPDIPTFAVDDGFAYRVPDDMADAVAVGSIVRIPLGGRRTRGWVVSIRSADGGGRPLKDIVSVSSKQPVLTPRLLTSLRWAAAHYVTPLAVMLRKAGPPNLPAAHQGADYRQVSAGPGPLPEVTSRLAEGRRVRTRYVLDGSDPVETVRGLIGPLLEASRSVLVVGPTVAEVSHVADHLTATFGDRVVRAWSSLPAKEVTASWSQAAASPGTVVVGTRETATWPIAGLGLALVLDEGRRAMKSPQTPTVHVRDILHSRAGVEGFGLMFIGGVPTAEVVAWGPEFSVPERRLWPLVELADRSTEPPGSIVMSATRQSIQSTVAREGRVFVFVPRRGYSPAHRCLQCGELHRCPNCGSGLDRTGSCLRCGAEARACGSCGHRRFAPVGVGIGRLVEDLARSLGGKVGDITKDRPVTVGTERDLVGVPDVALAVAVGVDSMLLAPNYRAGETSLRVLSRVAGLIERGRGHRLIVETNLLDHPALDALRRAEPLGYLGTQIAERTASGLPPGGEVIAIEVDGLPKDGDERLRSAVEPAGEVLGPAFSRERYRWLLQGRDLHPARVRLRTLIHSWREEGHRVRIDADPIDL